MNEFPHLSEGILGEEDIPKTNTELFLSMVAQYFPEAIKDGEVDFTALKEEMGEFSEVGSEHYDFTWAGKQAAKKKAQEDIFGKSLRYKPQDSLNPETTENIYIEGDNLEALQLLRRTYHGKIKMIYIDPPYNTGSDFVYHDDFSMTEEELAEFSGDVVDGIRYQKNSKDSSRYHTNWLNMMYPRLKIARELLTDDGVIFISIDDNEYDNLKKICDGIFGVKNFIANLIWQSTPGSNTGNDIKTVTENVLLYGKNRSICVFRNRSITDNEKYSNKDEYYERRGGFVLNKLDRRMTGTHYSEALNYPIGMPDGSVLYPGNSTKKQEHWNWRWSSTKVQWGMQNGFILMKNTTNNGWSVYFKQYEKVDNEDNNILRTISYQNFLTLEGANSARGTREVMDLLNGKFFDYPKPLSLIKHIQQMILDKNDIILDFFSGSATTAHAVMQLNAEDGGSRKFIMVQLPEICDEKSEAFKAGYSNICEIGKERIRRAAKKIHEDNPEAVFDDGFKVFEVGGTTIRWNTTNDDEIKQLTDEDYNTGDKDSLDFTPGHNDIDIVYEVMLRQYGIPLSTPIEKLTEISDRTYIFADAVVVCLEPEIDDKLIEKLAAIEPTPMKFVLRDSAFNDDIELKESSFRKLSALIRSHQTEEERKSKYQNYTVEFI